MYRVYLFEHPELVTEEFLAHALPLLPEERRRKAMRFRRMIDRKNCVITFLMLKIALKQTFHISDFNLHYGECGKPCLAGVFGVHFSISHCNCGCAVAVADCPVGVDIQDIRSFSWDIARMVCCREEWKALEQSAESDRDFIRLWTRKESYVKMLGKGIGSDLVKINTMSMESIRTINRVNSVISICIHSEL